jgi:hypothetical protein
MVHPSELAPPDGNSQQHEVSMIGSEGLWSWLDVQKISLAFTLTRLIDSFW